MCKPVRVQRIITGSSEFGRAIKGRCGANASGLSIARQVSCSSTSRKPPTSISRSSFACVSRGGVAQTHRDGQTTRSWQSHSVAITFRDTPDPFVSWLVSNQALPFSRNSRATRSNAVARCWLSEWRCFVGVATADDGEPFEFTSRAKSSSSSGCLWTNSLSWRAPAARASWISTS
jgi:hypothetical protein